MNGYIDDKNFALIDFIKEHKDNWEELLKKEPYNLKSIKHCFYHPEWTMFVYNLFDSKLTDPVVRNCRGVVINTNTHKPVSVPYTKFFGAGDPSGADIEQSINWANAKIQLKVDGIILKTACVNEMVANGFEKRLYFFTNGSFDLNAPFEDSLVYDEPATRGAETYGDLLKVALQKIDNSVSIHFNKEVGYFYITGGWSEKIPVGSTLMFELVSPRNKIICEYKETKLYLHGYRRPDLVEVDPREEIPKLIPESVGLIPSVKFEYPELLDASNFEDLKKLLATFDGNEKEGCVVVDYTTPGVPRVKIKCDSYLKLKFARDTSCNSKVLFKAVVFDEYDDLVAAVPAVIPKIDEIKEVMKKFTSWFVGECLKVGEVCKSSDEKTRKKEWALWCKENVDRDLFPYYMLMPGAFGLAKLDKKFENLATKKNGYEELKTFVEKIEK